jgi:hypothetical protein
MATTLPLRGKTLPAPVVRSVAIPAECRCVGTRRLCIDPEGPAGPRARFECVGNSGVGVASCGWVGGWLTLAEAELVVDGLCRAIRIHGQEVDALAAQAACEGAAD